MEQIYHGLEQVQLRLCTCDVNGCLFDDPDNFNDEDLNLLEIFLLNNEVVLLNQMTKNEQCVGLGESASVLEGEGTVYVVEDSVDFIMG